MGDPYIMEFELNEADACMLVYTSVLEPRMLAFAKKLVQSDCALHALHKYDNLKNPAIRKRQFPHVNKRQFSHVSSDSRSHH